MNTSDAIRRPAREGRGHLTLVTSQDTPAAPAEDDNDPEPVQQAPRVRMVPMAGSATVRALIALGALASALGLSTGKAQAVFGFPDNTPMEQADPSDVPVVEEPMPAVVGTHRAAAAPEMPAATVKTVTDAGQWTPATTRRPVTVAYKALPAGTGRHRKPSTERPSAGSPASGPGRHRRTSSNGHHHHHRGTTRAAATVNVGAPVPLTHVSTPDKVCGPVLYVTPPTTARTDLTPRP